MKFSTVLSRWLPVLALEAVIFYLSSIPGLELTREPVANFVTRKAAHIVEYAILGFLLYRAMGYRNKWHAFMVALLLAGSDEFHQSFVLRRTAKVTDVGFDAFGIYVGLLGYDLMTRHGIFNKKRRGN